MTLHWPPGPPEQLTGVQSWPGAAHGPGRDKEAGRLAAQVLDIRAPETELPGMASPGTLLEGTQLAESGPAGTAGARAGLTDPVLIGGIAEITAMIAAQLDDGASAAEVMPVIRDTGRWTPGLAGTRKAWAWQGHYPETTPLYGWLKERGLLDPANPPLRP